MLKRARFTDVDHFQLLPQYLESPEYLQNLVWPVVQSIVHVHISFSRSKRWPPFQATPTSNFD